MTAMHEPRSQRDPALLARILSAAILGPISIYLIYSGGQAFTAYVAAFAAAMAWEWLRMAEPDAPTRSFAVISVASAGAILFVGDGDLFWALAWPLAGAIGLAFAGTRPMHGRWRGPLGLFYVAVTAGALVWMRDMPDGLIRVGFLMCVVWLTDIFAYFAGTWLGGPKLFPKISPKKTWTGFAGGMLIGTLAGAVFAKLFGMPMANAIILAAVLALASVLGDLMMSLFKRNFGVKDSGRIIPGHGGILDRVDALMLATAVALVSQLALPGLWA